MTGGTKDNSQREPRPTTLEYIDTTDQCGQTFYWNRGPNGEWNIRIWFCHRHGCKACAHRTARRNGHRVIEYVGTRPCFTVTLTMVRDGLPLKKHIDRLYGSFRKLNRRPLWKRATIGGAWFFDCSYNDIEHRWGPHLNLIVEAEGSPLQWLSTAWDEITGGSWIVDASVIAEDMSSRESAVFYASKLAYKTFAENKGAMTEYLAAVKGRRKSQPFGAWYGKLKLGRSKMK